MSDQYVAVNSPDNVTFMCTVPPQRTVVWEEGREQIRTPGQFNDKLAEGIFVEPMNTDSMISIISISAMARENDDEIMVQCLYDQDLSSVKGEIYRVTTFGECMIST